LLRLWTSLERFDDFCLYGPAAALDRRIRKAGARLTKADIVDLMNPVEITTSQQVLTEEPEQIADMSDSQTFAKLSESVEMTEGVRIQEKALPHRSQLAFRWIHMHHLCPAYVRAVLRRIAEEEHHTMDLQLLSDKHWTERFLSARNLAPHSRYLEPYFGKVHPKVSFFRKLCSDNARTEISTLKAQMISKVHLKPTISFCFCHIYIGITSARFSCGAGLSMNV
jgi:hypothetical protein